MNSPFRFEVESRCPNSKARSAVLHTPHGPVRTPAFMPVGTRATVKGVLPRDLAEVGSQMLLANTYHLHLRPGEDVVRRLGGLHALMAWDGPILTDSGGFQVFSMGDICRIDEHGVSFKSIIDGDEVRFTPERVIDIQRALGPDIAMAFDQCPAKPGDYVSVAQASERTHRWLARCVARHRELGAEESGQALFGIVQGGIFEDLRRASVDAVCSHDLAGYAIGGVSVGEEPELIRRTVELTAPLLPEDKPRYLMGVGTPRDFFDAIACGIDLFDCVTPTRNARNHSVFTSRGRINLRNSGYVASTETLDPECNCVACTQFSLGALRHLCISGEMLAGTLLSIHNLRFFHSTMERIRVAIAGGTFETLRAEVVETYSRRVTSADL